ncbi:MAG: chemotaxis response regulator protein-glutamate methylesterase [Candidatus Omnitrophica bacterium]|nr:chemotaxis response regulator protein-glutamate methylesterase [Candidatus Omnitrophota bacterium]
MKKIRVFIVEDSVLMQKIIADILSGDPDIEVIGSTKYGKEALEKIPELKPDIVTLDVNLPDVSGLIVLESLMNAAPVKVVMLSAYTQKGAEATMKALELGALDFIPKPSGEVSLDLYNFKDEIISKIKLLAGVSLKKSFITDIFIDEKATTSVKNLVIIGASTGGPKAIIDIMHKIPSQVNANFLIVQHMPKGFTKSFAERISWHSGIKVKEVEDGDILTSNVGYVACSGYHMVMEKIPGKKNRHCLRMDDTPLVNYVRPALDVTMSSASEVFEGKNIIGVVLTGMGKDGAEGAEKIKAAGGRIIIQDEETSVVYGMPKAVAEKGIADDIMPLNKISAKIMEYLNNG